MKKKEKHFLWKELHSDWKYATQSKANLFLWMLKFDFIQVFYHWRLVKSNIMFLIEHTVRISFMVIQNVIFRHLFLIELIHPILWENQLESRHNVQFLLEIKTWHKHDIHMNSIWSNARVLWQQLNQSPASIVFNWHWNHFKSFPHFKLNMLVSSNH